MVQEIECDLLDAPVDAIAHICNCHNIMGSGVAKAIREEYPEVYEADCETKKGDKSKLGGMSYYHLHESDVDSHSNKQIKTIYNLYAQYNFGTEKRQLDYETFYRCLTNLSIALGPRSLGIPYKIGCGLAGGNYEIVKVMIYEVFKDLPNKVLICRRPGD